MTVESSPSTELVAQRIERLFATLTPELQRAARWLLSHQQEAAVLSMRRCAVMAGVSAPTMTRLAKPLDVTGFADIQPQPSTAPLSLAKQQLAAVRHALPADSYAANARLFKPMHAISLGETPTVLGCTRCLKRMWPMPYLAAPHSRLCSGKHLASGCCLRRMLFV